MGFSEEVKEAFLVDQMQRNMQRDGWCFWRKGMTREDKFVPELWCAERREHNELICFVACSEVELLELLVRRKYFDEEPPAENRLLDYPKIGQPLTR